MQEKQLVMAAQAERHKATAGQEQTNQKSSQSRREQSASTVFKVGTK